MKNKKRQELQQKKDIHKTKVLAGKILASAGTLESRLKEILQKEHLLSSFLQKKTQQAFKEMDMYLAQATEKLKRERPECYPESVVESWPSVCATWKAIIEAGCSMIAGADKLQ